MNNASIKPIIFFLMSFIFCSISHAATITVQQNDFELRTTESGQGHASVAMINNGTSLMVWQGQGTQALLTDKLGSRLAHLSISTPTGSTSHPIVSAGTNRFVVTWQEPTNLGFEVFVLVLDNNGNTLVAKQSITQGNLPWVSDAVIHPDIAMNKKGEFIVVWDVIQSGKRTIYGQSFNHIAQNTSPVTMLSTRPSLVIDPTSKLELGFPDVDINIHGDVAVVWSGYDVITASYPTVLRQLNIHTASWVTGDEQLLDYIAGAIQVRPMININNRGDMAASWMDMTAASMNTSKVFYKKYNQSQNMWNNAIRLAGDLDTGANCITSKLLEDGVSIVVFSGTGLDDSLDIYMHSYSQNNTLIKKVKVNDASSSLLGFNQRRPAIALSATASTIDIIVTWERVAPGESDIVYGKKYKVFTKPRSVSFADVSAQSGLAAFSPSFGAGSWGDYNADGLPDLWLGNHSNHPSLFVNQGNGTFIDIAPQVVQFNRDPYTIDAHGAQWMDIDRDGDQDLIEMTGGRSGFGTESSIIWLNQAGQLIDNAPALGLDYPACRGRTPLTLDWNLDGKLDILYTCAAKDIAPSQIFTQQSNGFFTPLPASQKFLPEKSNQYGLLTTNSNTQTPELYIHHHPRGGTLTSTSITPWQPSPQNWLTNFTGVVDSAFADIDGDLQLDFIAARILESNPSDVSKISNQQVNLSLLTNKGSVLSTTLQSINDIQVQIRSNPLKNSNIHIGTSGSIPLDMLNFTLQVGDPNTHGMPSFVAGIDTGIYIGYDTATSTWTITQTSTGYVPAAGIVSGNNIEVTQTVGFPQILGDIMLRKTTTGAVTTLPYPLSHSIVIADFDNDMDQDIYLVRSRTVKNLENVLLLNDGLGNFTETFTGVVSNVQGIGDAASTADFNGDGLLDILVTNGAGNKLLGGNGAVQLLQNTSSSLNHWLEIDLIGTTSNIEGIGATVIITTPDGKQQIRVQDGGMHKYTQNHSRLHFGLAQNTIIDTIQVIWPNSVTQMLKNTPADQILQITEQ